MGKDASEIRREIEETRARMGDTVEALGYKADVPARVKDAVNERVETVRGSMAEIGQTRRYEPDPEYSYSPEEFLRRVRGQSVPPSAPRRSVEAQLPAPELSKVFQLRPWTIYAERLVMRIIGLAVLCREPEAVIRAVSRFRMVAATKAVRPRAPTTRRRLPWSWPGGPAAWWRSVARWTC